MQFPRRPFWPLSILVALVLAFSAFAAAPTPANAATASMWGSGKPPGVAVTKRHAAVVLGTSFTPKTTGKATGVRFYRPANSSGKRTGTLWSASGKKLASVTFPKGTKAGWQTAKFKSAVTLKAGTSYVVSLHVPRNGRYAISRNFRGGSSSTALSVKASAAAVYRYGSKPVFPKKKRANAQYWVDVSFVPNAAPKPVEPSKPADPDKIVIPFDYASRAAMAADGWDFKGRTATGQVRDTEKPNSGIAFSSSGLRITAGKGDLWKDLNNSLNTVFRDLPADWKTAELALNFAPAADYQQAGLVVYGSDDDYVQVMRQYHSGDGGQSAAFVAESQRRVTGYESGVVKATALRLKLARSADVITGFISTDGGVKWAELGSAKQAIKDPRLGIVVGANNSSGSAPVVTLLETVITSGDQSQPTPRPTVTPTPTPTPTVTPTPTPKPTVTPTPTPTPKPTVTPTPTPTPTPKPTVTPTPTPKPTPTPTVPPAKGFPTRNSTGVPAGWQPKTSRTGDYTVTTDGAVVEDLRLTNGTLYVRAANVTLRRVEVVGGRIVNDYGRTCYNGLRIEDTSILRGSEDIGVPVVEAGGYTAVRVKIDGPSEGFRVGEKAMGCGSVVIEDSWMKLDPPDRCAADRVDWHGDGIQGYQGAALTVRNTYINLAQEEGCLGTAAFFYPGNQGNTRATVENVLLEGGGYVFRLGTPGSVSGLKVVNNSWEWGPVDVTDCSAVSWGSGNEVVTVNPDGSVKSVRPLVCEVG